MKKILAMMACFVLFVSLNSAFAAAITGPASHAVPNTDFTITASKDVTLTITSTAGTYSASADHAQGTKTYSTTQDAGISESPKGDGGGEGEG